MTVERRPELQDALSVNHPPSIFFIKHHTLKKVGTPEKIQRYIYTILYKMTSRPSIFRKPKSSAFYKELSEGDLISTLSQLCASSLAYCPIPFFGGFRQTSLNSFKSAFLGHHSFQSSIQGTASKMLKETSWWFFTNPFEKYEIVKMGEHLPQFSG